MFEFTASSRESVRRFFREGFRAGDVAEALVSYDGERDACSIRERMEARGFDAVGVRLGGLPVGYALREELTGGRCDEHLHVFRVGECVPQDESITRVLAILSERPRVFVVAMGTVHAIITREDVQKPPVRLWLFGLLTLLETTFTTMIRDAYTGDEWQEKLSEGRIARGQRLQQERARRGEHVDLLDCLHFADKADVVFRDEAMRGDFGFASRKEAREATNEAERLRNALAHSHDIVQRSWRTIVAFADGMDRILELYEQRHLAPQVMRHLRQRTDER